MRITGTVQEPVRGRCAHDQIGNILTSAKPLAGDGLVAGIREPVVGEAIQVRLRVPVSWDGPRIAEPAGGVLDVSELNQFPGPPRRGPGVLRFSQTRRLCDALKLGRVSNVTLIVAADLFIESDKEVQVRSWHAAYLD